MNDSLSEHTATYLNELKEKESELDAALKVEKKLWEPCLETIKQSVIPQLLKSLILTIGLFAASIYMIVRSMHFIEYFRNPQADCMSVQKIANFINLIAFFISLIYISASVMSIYKLSNLNVEQFLLRKLL